MSPTPRRRRAAPPTDPFPETGLAQLGIAKGDHVRFRRAETARWKQATVARREKDGSVGLHDPKGASRAIPIACIEVRGTGPRGGVVWEPLPDRAARTEQMALVSERTLATRRRSSTSATPDDAVTETMPTATARTWAHEAGDDGDEPGDLGQLTLL